ncbi:MAG: hypothetical protein AAGI11_13200 [Pseudomonadota bacterium]
MKTLQLEKLVQRIDNSFGEELPFSHARLQTQERDLLSRVFGDTGFQRFLQDQVSRQVIRDYTVNALRMGYLTEDDVNALACSVATVEGRASVSLHMLMSGVEEAPLLCQEVASGGLTQLEPSPDSPPHIEIVPS